MQTLPDNLYRVSSVTQLEQIAMNELGISADELMLRAGTAVFDVVRSRYPKAKNLLVVCGAGNNAGDGYVIATLAKKSGYHVQVCSLIDPASLKGAALNAYQRWSVIGDVQHNTDWPSNEGQSDTQLFPKIVQKATQQTDVIIDAMLGTGLVRSVSNSWRAIIDMLNKSGQPVVAVDIPSGLYADTGSIAGDAIRADVTVCFIGLKQGLFTSQARDYCGEVTYCNLTLPKALFTRVDPDARLIQAVDYSVLPARKAASHKGCFGHVLIVGGNDGMPGAVILAARAALRTGAGLVTIITIKQHLAAISAAVPEAMLKVCTIDHDNRNKSDETDIPSVSQLFSLSFIEDVKYVAIGMGLGQDDWSKTILQHCLRLEKPLLIDADGLNLLACHRSLLANIAATSVIVTPHPGEAARLLSDRSTISTTDIQQDRFTAVSSIHDLFKMINSCTVVLKGSGTLIFDGHITRVCNLGSAAMASPGMGDVLSGIIIALQTQGLSTDSAAELGVCLHASAALRVVGSHTRGLLASDVIDALPELIP